MTKLKRAAIIVSLGVTISLFGQGCNPLGDTFSTDGSQTSQSSSDNQGSGNNGGGNGNPPPPPPPPPASASFTETFSTFLGGSGSEERIQGVFVDRDDSIYVGGQTDSFNFPVTSGAFQTTKSGGTGLPGTDGFIAKISPDGSRVIWATYFGGDGRDALYTVRTDSQGNVYAVGATSSTNLPTSTNAHRRTLSGAARGSNLSDFFVAKFTSQGNFVWATYIGGSNGREENPRGSIWIDETRQRIYIAGLTGASDFPNTAGGAQPGFGGGGRDAVVFALSMDGSQVLAATYLGGAGGDFGFGGIVQDLQGNIFVSGATSSTTLPLAAGPLSTGLKNNFNGTDSFGGDAFVAKLTPDLSQLLWFKTIGGSGVDAGSHNQGLGITSQGEPVILTNAQSADFPVTQGAYQLQNQGQNDCAITKLSTNGQIVASTFVGGSGFEECNGIFIDDNDQVIFSGRAIVNTGYPTTNDALHRTSIGGRMDAIFTVLSPNLDRLVYSTFVGGNDDGMNGGGNDSNRTWEAPEKGRSIWAKGNRYYLSGVSDSSRISGASSGALQPRNAGQNDAMLVRFDFR